MDVLILGGTRHARALAQRMVDDGVDAVTSLAGVTSSRRPLPGATRVGGFGGVDGLVDFLRENRVKALVNATHPFAGSMTAHAALAAAHLGLPLLRLQAPSWRALPESGEWTWVADHDEAARAAAAVPGTVLLTVGRQPVPRYLAPLAERTVIARCIDAPDGPPPARWTVLRDRGPFTLESERTLLTRVDAMVSKDSGGSGPDPKLVAARESGVAVVMISRPSAPAYGEEVATPEQAAEWVRARLG
jgi:precorrin-6A/cobalt-precorrin-6A reductase